MKLIKINLVILTVISLIYTSNAESQWIWQNGLDLSIHMQTKFVNDNTGYAVGYSAYCQPFYRTTNGGDNWIVYSKIQTTNQMKSLSFPNTFTGWIVGQFGSIYKTFDGGQNWTYQTGAGSSNLNCVYFLDSFTGWISGQNGILYNTTNGGTNWNLVATGITNSLNSIHFGSITNGAIVGSSGLILFTTNGGLNWITGVSNTTSQLWSVFFTIPSQAWAVGEKEVIRYSEDGGGFWGSNYTSGVTSTLRDVHRNIIVGDNNVILKFSSTWSQLSTNYNIRFRSCFNNAVNQLILSGNDNVLDGLFIIKSVDNGSNWISNSYFNNPTFYSINFISSSTGWVCGTGGKILKTTNSGAIWIIQPNTQTQDLKSIFFINNSNGWCVGNNGLILKTMTGGISWTSQPSPTSDNLLTTYFITSTTGWAAGINGTIIKTTNGGTSWFNQSSGISSSIYSVKFRNVNSGFFVSDNGLLFKTTNGGNNWEWKDVGTTNHLYSVYFVTDNIGWTAGNVGVIYKTTDAGENWFFQAQTGLPLNEIKFVSPLVGIAAGSAGKTGRVYFTSNGGTSWDLDTSNNLCNSVYGVSTTYPSFTISGTGGMILKRSNGFPTNISQNIISEIRDYNLFQNYPNPFNPSTKIKYSVRENNQSVRLRVFDNLGKEVSELVNEKLNAGVYETEFDGRNLSSGVFYYKFETNDFVETKKMILLR